MRVRFAVPRQPPIGLDRRRFLTGAAAAALGATAEANAEAAMPAGAADGAAPSDPRALSYRETAHIRHFYAKCRF